MRNIIPNINDAIIISLCCLIFPLLIKKYPDNKVILVNALIIALRAGKTENQLLSEVFPGRKIINATKVGTNTEIKPINRFLVALPMTLNIRILIKCQFQRLSYQLLPCLRFHNNLEFFYPYQQAQHIPLQNIFFHL